MSQNINLSLKVDVAKSQQTVKAFSKDFVKLGKTITDTSKDAATKMDKNFKKPLEHMQTGLQKVDTIASKIFGPLGISLGIAGLVSQAFHLNQQILGWHNGFRQLSDSTGDTTKAVKTMTSAWGKSYGSISAVQGVMSALGSKGLPVANKNFEHMTIWITNMGVATGISADALADFTVGLNQAFDVSLQSTKDMVSAMVAMGDGFGYTNTQIQEMMQTTQGILKKVGVFFDDVQGSMKEMTKSIGSAAVGLKKMGVSAQASGDFIQNILDPEKINENMGLFSRLGISYGETMDMMSSAGGQETFMDKLMTNLPALSRQITALKNPMAKLQFSKSLGLPLEIAQKMAKGTGEEIQGIMEDYKKKAVDDKAANKKQEGMKADAAKWDDQMNFIKMKALGPLMAWVGANMGKFQTLLSGLAGVFSKLMDGFVWIADKIVPTIFNVLEPLLDGDISGAIGAIGKAVIDSFTTNPIFTTIAAILTAGFAASKAMQVWTQMKWAFMLQLMNTTGVATRPGMAAKGTQALQHAGDVAGDVAGDAIGSAGKVGKASKFGKIGKFGKVGAGIGVSLLTGFAAAKAAEYFGAGEGEQAVAGLAGSAAGDQVTNKLLAKGGSKVAGKVAGNVAVRGGLNAAKAIPVAGWALAAAMVIYDGAQGAMNAANALGKGAMNAEETAELQAINDKKKKGYLLTSMEKEKEIALLNREKGAKEQNAKDKEISRIEHELAMGRTISKLDSEKLERLKKDKSGSSSFKEKSGGALAGILTMGGLLGDRDDWTKKLVGSKKQKEEVRVKEKSASEEDMMKGGTGQSLMGAIGDTFKNPIASLMGGPGISSYLSGKVMRGAVAATGADTATGKGFFSKDDKNQMELDKIKLDRVKKGQEKMNKWDKKALETKLNFETAKQAAFFTSDDMANKRSLEQKMAAVNADKTLSKEAKDAKLDAMSKEYAAVIKKQKSNSLDFGDAMAVGLAKIAKMIGFQDEMPYIAVRIKNTFSEMGLWIQEAVENIWWNIKNPLTDATKLNQVDNLSKIETIQNADGSRVTSKENLKLMQDIYNKASAGSEKDRIGTIITNYDKQLKETDERWAKAKVGVDLEKKKAEAEAAATDAKKHKEVTGLLAGGNKNTDRIAENTEKKTSANTKDYIDFWMRNQGFSAMTLTTGN